MSPSNRRSELDGGLFPDEWEEAAPIEIDAETVDAETVDAHLAVIEPQAGDAEHAAAAEAIDAPAEPARPKREGRLPSLRVASLHLRMGQHALARAELESFAGRGLLDDQALLDLAEVRWRSGDLVGATEAASVLITGGHETLLALVIAAEGFAASGRMADARQFALRAVELAGAGLEPVFAGMPSSGVWPVDALPDAVAADLPDSADAPGEPGGALELAGLAAPRALEPELETPAEPEPVELELPEPQPQPEPQLPGPALEPIAPIPGDSPADKAIAAAGVALHSGRIDQASLLFGLALRLDPSSAAYVLLQLDPPASDPRLALVEGDALQLLGRDPESREAFRRAGGSLLDGSHKR